MSDRPKLFIDYASEDENIAGLISEGLRSGRGIDVFFAPWLLPGDEWVSAIEKALQEAEHVAVFLSPKSINKEWPTAERNAALSKAIKKTGSKFKRVRWRPTAAGPCPITSPGSERCSRRSLRVLRPASVPARK